MISKTSAKNPPLETVQRIEPARLEVAPEAISDVVAELAASSSALGHTLHPRTAASLAELVRIMNTYYSNLIEGHNTRPRDIARALAGDLDRNAERRNLQIEAAAHVRVQAEVDRMALENRLPEPASASFIQWLHREFYRDAPEAMLLIRGKDREFLMRPGEWRSRPEEDVAVGRHQPPSRRASMISWTTFRLAIASIAWARPARSWPWLLPITASTASTISGRQRPRQPVDESCDGPCRRNRCAWTVVDFARPRPRPGEP
jgi:hypothetical protein